MKRKTCPLTVSFLFHFLNESKAVILVGLAIIRHVQGMNQVIVKIIDPANR